MLVQRDVRSAPRALLVAIEDPFGLALAAELERLGWVAHRARCGRDALSRWSAIDPQAVVVDLDGGDMDAVDLLQGIAATGSQAAVTACVRSAARVRPQDLADLGIAQLVTRPCRVDRMAKAVVETVAPTPADLAVA